MDFEQLQRFAQQCAAHHPTIVLGSGASIPHGIRGMAALADFLRTEVHPSNSDEESSWQEIETAIARGDGLENALQNTNAPPSLIDKIVNLTWQAISLDDLILLNKVARGQEALPLSYLIEHLFRSTNTTLNIVTTNYDRLAEYSSDIANQVHSTGFFPGIIRRREGNDTVQIRRGNYPAKVVKIWKVHGSIDWFHNAAGIVLSLPLSGSLPEGYLPTIVTPGVGKYERTHDEPFRSAIQGADLALGTASSFLCVGYGFRDAHIQPKLIERCRQRNVPIVVLARTLTDEARHFLKHSAGNRYLAMEDHASGTHFFCADAPDGQVLLSEKIWSLEAFNQLVM